MRRRAAWLLVALVLGIGGLTTMGCGYGDSGDQPQDGGGAPAGDGGY